MRMRIYRNRVVRCACCALVVAAALLGDLCGCAGTHQIDRDAENFLDHKPYSAVDLESTVITNAGDTVRIPPLYGRYYALHGDTVLAVQAEPKRTLPSHSIRALTFGTDVVVETRDGHSLPANRGAWWFLLREGNVDLWTASDARHANAPLTLRRAEIARIFFPEPSHVLSWLLFGAGMALGILAIVLIMPSGPGAMPH